MADASSGRSRADYSRTGDQGWRSRAREWWAANGVQVVVFVLLGVIVAGEVSDYFNDREQARADTKQEATNEALVCAVGNLSEQSSESLRRLREQAPTLQAARAIIAAQTVEERLAAAEALREVGVPTFDSDELAEPADCPEP